ncbi:hypothetical protein TanjilG_06859 [Lupinus angustifolius]|uniref:Uncharacterized protein n=1 Tax=Lupinus angustifolius TaxID=3871 RepID=A0A4P1RS94_LUPAN|nr:hypothetical protein TanjilG_06859 [Lupinus angustifolius]
MTGEKGKSIANVGKEDDGFECSVDYDHEHLAYLTPLKRLGSSTMFDDTQDLVFAQMSTTKNAKHVNNE